MITSIRLQNYKAFKDVTIPLKPLTILLGANSVGKSSILQMLMLLHQTAEEKDNIYSSALKIYGNDVNIGAYENLFKGKDASNPLVLTISLDSSSLMKEIRGLKNDYINELTRISRIFFSQNSVRPFSKRIQTKDDFLSYIQNLSKEIRLSGIEKKTDSDIYSIGFLNYYLKNALGCTVSTLNKTASFSRTFDYLDFLENSLANELNITYELVLLDNKLTISRLIISTSNENILEIRANLDKNVVMSDIITLTKSDQQPIIYNFNNNTTLFNCMNTRELRNAKTTPISFVILKVFDIIQTLLRNDFSGYMINHVSPLRAHPKRYYMLDKAKSTISLDTLDGDAIAEILKENKIIKKKVNDWFSKFYLNIDVKEIREVIHHLNVKQNKLDLDITDVGFGISQVLPIIIQSFLSPPGSITMIEQPEIHLHPKMQADMGDLFIDIVKDKSRTILIETHSEYLLRRIRRRISEREIHSSMVSICLFHPKTTEKDAWVECLDISETGNFTWPEDFYDGELYNDTIEFLKNQ